MSEAVPPPTDRNLRIAVLGDFDGIHTRSWLRWFVERGHEVHAISFYPPAERLPGVNVHALRPRDRGTAGDPVGPARLSDRVPRGLMRLANGARYVQAGLRGTVASIRPDVLHGHFVVEHGFYGSLAGFHPYVVTAWGSDVLVEPRRDPVSRMIALRTLRFADLSTSNNAAMAQRMIRLGAAKSKIAIVTLGADRYFTELWSQSVNVRGRKPGTPPTILSTRAHEPLYNIGDILQAYRIAHARVPDAALVVAHSGSLTESLREAASRDRDVHFTGTVDAERLRDLMSEADVFVSVPSSDGTSVALLQAMAAGAFPIVADLDTQREWIDHGRNGLLVPPCDPVALADAIGSAVADDGLRRSAATINREIVESRGLNEVQMARMEDHYLRLAGRAPRA